AAGQIFKKRILFTGEGDGGLISAHNVTARVDGKVTNPQHGFLQLRPAPQKRANAGQQFTEIERFCEVVIGSAVEAGDPIIHFDSGGEQQYGGAKSAFAKTVADFQAVEVGKHDVENNEIVGVAVRFF